MGPLSTASQLREARGGIEELMAAASVVTGGTDPVAALGVPEGKGYFLAPTLLRADEPEQADVVHRLEVFGPVATIMPYDGTPESATELVRRGEGSLVTSAYGDDPEWLRAVVAGLAAWNGRLYLGSKAVSKWPFGSGAARAGRRRLGARGLRRAAPLPAARCAAG